MIIEKVVVLEEAADDLEAGKVFYDQRELGVGSYFWDSLIADIESLSIFGGIHAREYGDVLCLCPADNELKASG